MKTHLPTGLRKALIAAIFAVSAVAYNAQAATEYTEDAELGIIDTTTPGTPSYDRQVSIRNGAEITVSGGVTVNGLLVSEGATLDSASTVRSDNDGSTPGVIGVTTNSKIDVEHGSLISGSSVLVSDHGTVIVQDGGLSTGYHGSYPANGVLGIDDHSKVSVTNGDIDLRADLVVNDRSELTQKDGHLTIENGDMYITNHSQVTIKNGNLTIGGKTEDIGGGLEDIKSGALVIDGTDNVHDVYLKVTSGKGANGNVQALVVGVNKADLIVGGDLTATVGAVYLNEAETTIGGNVLTNSGLAVSEGTLKAGDVTVTNEWLLKQAGKIIEDASGHGHDTQVSMLNGASAMMADRILGVELEDVSEATVGHVDSAGSIIVTESTLKAESLVANDTVAEAIYNKISDEISEAVADEVKLPTSNIVLVGSDVTVAGEVTAADSILVEGEVTLPDDTKVVKGFLKAGGDVTAGGTLEVHKADLTAANVNADCGVIIEGAPKVEVDGVMQDNRNTIVTGDITVENVTATADAVAAIIEAKAAVGDVFADDEEALAALAARKDELQQSLGDVSIENVRKSIVGDVTTNGDIVIKGSKLTADSLTADATDVREALTTIIENKFGTAGVEALADALPTVSITVEDSKVNVKGKVTSDTTIAVKNGYLAATGDVTANDGDITAEDADLTSANMTAEHGAITVEGGSLNATGDVTADAGLTVSGNEEGTSTLTAGAISVVNNDAIADTKDTIAEISDKIGTIVGGDTFTKDAAITALQAESLDLAGVTIIDMAEGSAVGDVTTNGSIKIFGSTMQADSLTADSTEVREDIINTIKANAKLGGAEAVEKLENLQPAQSSIRVVGSDVMVTGDVYSETGIEVHGGDNGASLLAAGTVTAADGSINAYEADLASGDMTVEHGRVVVLGGSLDATGDVKADAGLLLTGNEEGTSSLNAASITVANKDIIAATQDTIKEIDANALLSPEAKEAAVAGEIANLSMLMGVDVQGVTSGTVGDVDVVGDVTIAGSTLTTGSLNADASSLREAIAGTIEDQFGATLAEQMLDEMPVAKITVTDSTLTVTGDVTSESTIATTDSTVKVTGDVAAAETITVNGGKLIAEGAVTAPETVTVNGATLKAQTIEAETLVINDGEEAESKVKVEDTITADIDGVGGTITSTGTEGKGLTIDGNVKSEGVTIKAPEGDLTVNGTISGDSTTLTTKGEGDIHVNKINNTEGTTMTAANGDITIDTLSNLNEQMTVKSTKGGVTVTNDSVATLKESAITAKEDITIGDAAVNNGMDMLALTGGTTVTSTKGDITLNQNVQVSDENTAITAAKGTVTFASYANMLQDGATVTADTIELAEGAKLRLGENSADALQGKLSGKGMIIASWDDLNRAADFDDSAFNGYISMHEHTLTIANTGVGAEAQIGLYGGADLNVTSTGASLGNVTAYDDGSDDGSVVTINAGTIDTETTASTIAMWNGSTLNIDASADSADLITVTKGIAMGAHTVHVTAQESLESIEGDVTHTIIKLADGAVNEVMSEEVKYDLDGGQRALQGKNMSLVNAGDHVDLVISTNYRGTEKTKPNQTAVNTPLKELSAEVPHNPGVLAEMPSDLAHVLDALDNTRSEGATLDALQSLSAAGNLVVTNMMMDSSRNHLSTLRSHMGEPTCKGKATGGNMWAAYTGGHDFIGADEYTSDYTRQHQGAILGTDYSLSCNTSVGISLGYESAKGHQDSVRADIDTMFADLYTTVKAGAFTHRFSAGVALHDIDTKRHTYVSAAAHTYTGNSTGSMDAISWNLGYELSYDVQLSSASTLTPFAAIDVAIHQMDTLTEKGQGDASVITEYDEPVQVDVALGAAYTYSFASGAALSASAAVHAELSENQPEATNRFAGAGRAWTTKSAERAPIYGEIGASVVLPVTASTSLIGGGNFEFSADRTSVGGNVGVNVKF
ncbi:MAG: autotransporter domain-containing protein [Akkermansia sp.]|nr:autotransporter domain-containing protein [Akkermansia sp.]